jgi:dTDP-4-amino-4,6-dideoxygalactose transaminase
MIPMVDLKLQYEQLETEIEPAVLAALKNAHYILGPNVTAFEQEAAEYLGCKYALGVANGSDALIMALRALKIGPGDEVITPSFTFIATVSAILHVGATPVFIDIDPNNFNLDLAQIEALITPQTKAILPVHLYGNPADMPKLMSLASQHQVKVIEDCAQSFGASWQGQMTGTFGDCATFSFYPSKNLACLGDGGMVATNSEETYKTLLALRNHGSFVRYHHEMLGYNSRLDELQAAILRVKLKHIDSFNQRRAKVALQYNALLADVVTTPRLPINGQHIFHQYTILHPQRDAIMAALKAANISSMIYYPIPLHRQELFKGKYHDLHLPVTEEITQQCVSLPIYPEMTSAQVKRVAEVILDVLAT